ncbi:MAG: LPS export ABC transporter periplasmic protein LptC [Bacteroidota bacterium]
MHNKAKQAQRIFLPALLISMLLLVACENDLNKIKQVSALQVSQPIDTTRGLEIIYSDSAIVKAKVITPLMIQYNAGKAYFKMPDGVKVIHYDIYANEDGNIVADSGIYRKDEQIMEFHKNVVVSDAKGRTFKSDELIWDQVKKIIYSNKPVQMTNKEGDVMYSINFSSDEDLKFPKWDQATGNMAVSGEMMR